jgi:putative transcriptional regulator
MQMMNNNKEQSNFESLVEALGQAIDYEKGNKKTARVRVATVPDIVPIANYSKEKIREIRYTTNLPQKHFAELFGVSQRSVEAWEAGTRKPTGSAKRLFQLIERDPTIINNMIQTVNHGA